MTSLSAIKYKAFPCNFCVFLHLVHCFFLKVHYSIRTYKNTFCISMYIYKYMFFQFISSAYSKFWDTLVYMAIMCYLAYFGLSKIKLE